VPLLVALLFTTLLERGAAHEEAGRLAEATRDYTAARVEAERTGDRETLSRALMHLGYLEYYRGDFNDSLVNLQRAYDLARAIGHAELQRNTLENIAHVYADSKVAQYDRAIEYYLQLLPQYESSGEAESAADTLYNLGSTFERKNDLASALEWYRRGLAAEEKLGRAEEAAAVKRSIGATLGKLGRAAEALPMLDDALRVFVARNDVARAMTVRQSRGIVHRRAGNISAAIADLEATRTYFAQQKNTRFLEKTEEELALVYATAGRWHDAYDARSRHAALQRELAEKLREEHTSRLRVQFDAERKEQENRALLRDKAAAERIDRLQIIILILGASIILVLAYLMFRLGREKRRMREMAMTDELTRLPNRRHFFAVAEQAHGAFSLLAFDIDHFKRINDTWGHATGDVVLQRVAHACRAALRPGDAIGRTGGEEFMVLLPSTNEHAAVNVAERLRSAVESIDFHDVDPHLRVTISIGVAERTRDESFTRLSALADELLYRAKETGRNRVVSTSATASDPGATVARA
jgi:diguanylate cyclase (GGDEF)-like protein